MNCKIKYKDNKILLKNQRDFIPKQIFECGQCFRWDREEDGSYTGVAHGRVLNVKQVDNNIILKNTNGQDFENIWFQYFDLRTNYSKIKEELSHRDKVMQKAVSYGQGIRILKQEPWETLISFIISANSNIPRIKKSVELLSERYGQYLGKYFDKERYAFPQVDILADLSVGEIKNCGVGYRAPYIRETAAMVRDNPNILEEIGKLSTKNCQKRLEEFKGVGPKVAHCVLFFCMGKMEAFPVDVWVKRVMEQLYFDREATAKEIHQFAQEKFGQYAGYAQQYLFYYARELAIGKG